MMADETAAEAERAAEASPFVDAETFGVDATEGTAADGERRGPSELAAAGYGSAADRGFALGGYLGALGVYAGAVGAVSLVGRLTGRPVNTPTPWDVVVGAAATHQLSRLDTRGDSSGGRQSSGFAAQLSRPSNTGVWVMTGLSAGYALAPRTTRLAAAGLAALTGSDFLRYARDRLSSS